MKSCYKVDVYKEVNRKLTELVNKWDPIDLICIGAPHDEYSCLVSEIYSYLKKQYSKDEVYNKSQDYLARHFGVNFNSIPEPYKTNHIEQMNIMITEICDWFVNECIINNEQKLIEYLVGIKFRELEVNAMLPFKVAREFVQKDFGCIVGYIIGSYDNCGEEYYVLFDSEVWSIVKDSKTSYELVIVVDEFDEILAELGR